MSDQQQQQQAEVSVATDSKQSIVQEVQLKQEISDTDTEVKEIKANIINLSFNEFELLFETISDLRRLGFSFEEILNNCDNVDFYNLKTVFEFYSIPVNTNPPSNIKDIISNKRKLSISNNSEINKRVKKFDTPEWLNDLTIHVSSDESDESDIENDNETNNTTNYNNNNNNNNNNFHNISNNNNNNATGKTSNIINRNITTNNNNNNSSSHLQMMAIQKRIDELERNKKQRESSYMMMNLKLQVIMKMMIILK
ncbi:unnamed protein product [[Candida] boidinii]|nr:unnamed protein product [[Candida] boidinii]